MISHDCHSYLCLTLAHGIARRKAVVMAGENVANDVDEEVYVGDGVVSQEAQEVSAGDRRAIADADQARQLDVSGETRAARALRTSKRYTDTYRDSHDAIRHKSGRTLVHSFQQFHLPFHLQFVTQDLCSQDLLCDLTAERHSSICLEHRMFHLCACSVI